MVRGSRSHAPNLNAPNISSMPDLYSAAFPLWRNPGSWPPRPQIASNQTLTIAVGTAAVATSCRCRRTQLPTAAPAAGDREQKQGKARTGPAGWLRVRAGGTLVHASVGSILASGDRLGLDKSEALVKAPRGIVRSRCRLRVLMDGCG